MEMKMFLSISPPSFEWLPPALLRSFCRNLLSFDDKTKKTGPPSYDLNHVSNDFVNIWTT